MKKRFLGIVFSLVLVISSLPICAMAADEHMHTVGETNITFGAWSTSDALPNEAGNYYLDTDVTLTSAWSVPSGVTYLDLNGHVIKQTGNNQRVIYVKSGATLNLYDCGTTEHYFSDSGNAWELLNEKADGCKTVTGGVITGGNISSGSNESVIGGGVYVAGTFNMYSGTISGCTAIHAGGVRLYSGSLNMYGGTISGCSSSSNDSNKGSGGGIHVNTKCTFNFSGGTIEYCKAPTGSGGGIYSNGTINMSNSAKISNCAASETIDSWGGAIAGKVTLNMSGGTISNCKATYGGAVYVNGKVFKMSGGIISGCEAKSGGAVNVAGTLNMTGGKISNCIATGDGGGVYVGNSGAIALGDSAQISGNKKGSEDNNIYLSDGKLIELKTGDYAPKSGMSVGVTAATAPTVSTPVALTGENVDDYSSYFYSDNSAYELKNVNNVLKLMKKGEITNNTPEGKKSDNGGYITIDKESAWSDETVAITVFPNIAYTLKSLKYNDGTEHDITEAKSFTMPTADVIVTAVFEHKHSFMYSVDDTDSHILKATCIEGCPDGYYMNPFTLTLTQPSNPVYDGSEKAVNFADGEAEAWKTATGTDAPTITYTAKEGSTLTDGKAVKAGSYTAAATIDTDKTATLDFAITPVTLTMDMTGVAVTKTYDKTNGTTVSKGILTGILTADEGKVSVQESAVATFNGANVGTDIAVTLTEDFVLSGDAAGNYSLTQPSDITGSITAKDVADTRDAVSQTVIIGEGTFTDPVFHDTALDEDITGTLTYTYNSETKTKQEIEAILATLSQGAAGTISYSYVSNGNYTGTITGTINYTAEGIMFKVAGEEVTVANAITVKDTPAYGDTWDEIITISDDIVVSVNGKTGSGTYTLNVSGTPNVGSHGYSVLFNGTVNGKAYTDVTVLSGNVTIGQTQRTDIPTVSMSGYKYGADAVPEPSVTPEELAENPAVTYFYNTVAEIAGAEVWENITSTTLNAGTYYMFALIDATESYTQCYTEFVRFNIAKANPIIIYPQVTPTPETEEAQGEEKADEKADEKAEEKAEEKIEEKADEKTDTPAEEYTAPAVEYDEQIEAGEASVPVKAEISDGIAAVKEITEDELNNLLDGILGEAADSKGNEVTALTINLSQATQDVTGIDLTAKTLKAVSDVVNDESNPIESVKIEFSEAIVELDAKTLEAVIEDAEGNMIRLVVEDTEAEGLNKSQNTTLKSLAVDRTFEAYFESAGKRIHDFKGGNARVSLSFKPEKGKRVENYKVYYIDENGKYQKMTTKYENGLITFVTSHFSDYAVVYENVQEVLLTEASMTSKGNIRLTWNEIEGAVRYVVYGARCGKSYKKLAEQDAATDGSSFTVKRINGAKPVKGNTYKFYVAAYDALGNKVKSKAIHFIAGNTSGKCGNVETITALQKNITLTIGEKAVAGVEYTVFEDKKRVSEKHGAALRFTSDCPDVAKVAKDGTITAKGEGKAVIYIQDVSGKWCRVEVTVKEK